MLLDHLAVAGSTLEEAVAYIETTLGVTMSGGGRHARYGTHNRLLGLADGLYLEAIAIDPSATSPKDARWFDLDRFAGPARLSNWVLRVEDLEALLQRFPQAGRAVDLKRGDLSWLMAVPKDGVLPMSGCFPAFLQWLSAPILGETLAGSGCRLLRLEIAHPDAIELRTLLGLNETRVMFEPGEIGLQALFETPNGKRILT